MIRARPLPLNQLGQLVNNAIAPYCDGEMRQRLNERIFRQVLEPLVILGPAVPTGSMADAAGGGALIRIT